ncbi:MAG TPA: hypothetical protein DDW90_03430 [Cyanobacteria bacterium UBA9971]|nr:hypothetical protein [Cyanobacteria bacterium UBA9971]
MSTPKDKLEEMVKLLDDFETQEVIDFVGYIREKRKKMFDEMLENAPVDEESLTEAELQAIEQARKDLKAGKTISHEKFWGKYDLQD